MFTRVVQIHVHLTGIGVGELAALEIDDHEATELAMEEQQIDPVPFVSDAKPTLSANESKIAAQLQKKSLEMQNERFFNLGLGIFVFESEELEHVRVFDFFFRRNRVFRLCRSALAEHFCFVSRQRGPLYRSRSATGDRADDCVDRAGVVRPRGDSESADRRIRDPRF